MDTPIAAPRTATEDTLARMEATLAHLAEQIQDIRKLVGPFGLATGDNRLLVQTIHGVKYFVPADDLLITPNLVIYRNWEANVSNALYGLLDADSVFVDVGANFGYFACLAGRLIGDRGRGEVIAIEPNPAMLALLDDNLAVNWSLAAHRVVRAAAGEAPGYIALAIPERRQGNAQVRSLQAAATGRELVVPLTTVDEVIDASRYAGRRVVVKIDVEGYEYYVLRGMSRLLAASDVDLTLILEWSPQQMGDVGSDLDALGRLVVDLGFSIHDVERGVGVRPTELSAIPYTNLVLRRA